MDEGQLCRRGVLQGNRQYNQRKCCSPGIAGSLIFLNGDRSIDIVDALLISQFYVGLISTLNCYVRLVPCPCATLPPGWFFDIHGVVRDAVSSVPISARVRFSLDDYPSYSGNSLSDAFSGYYMFEVRYLPCHIPSASFTVTAPGYNTISISASTGSACSSYLFNFEMELTDPQPTPDPASEYSIAGSVETSRDVIVRLSGENTSEIITDSNGNYAFSHLVPGGSYTIEPVTDTAPPSVLITHPVENNTLTGIVDVSASIETGMINTIWLPEYRSISALYSDLTNEDFYQVFPGTPAVLSNVSVFIDGKEVQTGATGGFTCDTRLYDNGVHTVRVTALDTKGNSNSHEINVNIDN